jgi:hypothetical protein
MIYEKKNEMCEKYLKEPSGWILETIKRELNISEFKGDEGLEELNDRHDMALAYWRHNCGQYPPERVWDRFHFDLLYKSFESRYELQAWCVARVKQLKDHVYLEEQRQQRKKVEEEKRLAWEVEQQRSREDPRTWEYHIAKAKENNRRRKAAKREGTTSETWPAPRPEEGNLSPSLHKFDK